MDTDLVCGSRSQENSIEIVCQGIQDEAARQYWKSLTCFSVVLCNATTWSCESVGLNHDVCESVEQRKTIEVQTLRQQPSTFPRNTASHIWQLDCVTLISGALGGVRRGKHSTTLFHNSNEGVRMAGLNHIDTLLNSKYTAKDMGNLGFVDSDTKSLLLLNRVFRVGTDQMGQWVHHGRYYKTSWCKMVERVLFWREKIEHDTDLLAWDFPIWPKT